MRRDRSVADAITQPLHDMNIARDELPATVVEAAREPYRQPTDCGFAGRDLARLDAALGPDVNAPSAPSDTANRLATGVVDELVTLPFRGILREVSGARAAERRRQEAILAAFARRSYLKGWRRGNDCLPTAPHAG